MERNSLERTSDGQEDLIILILARFSFCTESDKIETAFFIAFVCINTLRVRSVKGQALISPFGRGKRII